MGLHRVLLNSVRGDGRTPRAGAAQEPALGAFESRAALSPGAPAEATPRRRLRVCHVITGLNAGGAEMALYRLISATRKELLQSVISLTDGGRFGPRLSADGVSVSCLSMRFGLPNPLALVRLTRQLKRERPDIVHGWMYHANLLAGLAARAAGGTPVIWGIRHSGVSAHSSKRFTRWTNDLCARLSGSLPSRIVCCAESALGAHEAIGYRVDRMMVIPNGFAADAWAPEPEARARVRAELAVPEPAPIVGLVSRFHPDKDPDNFLRAARRVAEANRRAVFVLAGSGLDGGNPALTSRVAELGLAERTRLLGIRSDVPSLLSAMDVFALSSRSEAFPNALAEAMLARLPCAATDCGDSREILGSFGRIVPPEDSIALSEAILDLLSLNERERADLGSAARRRVLETYDIRDVSRRYLEMYAEVCGAPVDSGSEPQRSQAGEFPCG
jgi:glycosyltransferase involved in cell wall biosynthesis